ncbi:MAG: hypothetical protein Q8N13_11165 [Acidovorax sp.]|nr:hypothetical protein [Acidovorax sp.]
MACPVNQIVSTISFNGINMTPTSKTALINVGGLVADGTTVDNANRASHGTKVEPATVDFSVSKDQIPDLDSVRGQCGDLMYLKASGEAFLVTDAMLSAPVEDKDGESNYELKFIGSPAIQY